MPLVQSPVCHASQVNIRHMRMLQHVQTVLWGHTVGKTTDIGLQGELVTFAINGRRLCFHSLYKLFCGDTL